MEKERTVPSLLLPVATIIAMLFSICQLYPQSLEISDNKRFIQHKGGDPSIWIGDTAWELFHKLDKEEAGRYLQTRKEQGFTIVQAVVLAELDGLRTPNSYGELPLLDADPTRPNSKYFEHVDFIINKANELGLVIGLLPTWGDKVYSVNPGAGPVIFNQENAEKFGEFLGKRYKNKQLIWILGGDRTIDNLEVQNIWRSMASGLRKGDTGNHLITFHPRGESSSSFWLHNEPWLDFNMYQSGHNSKYSKVYNWAETDYLKFPPKPVVDGEPAYEDIPVKFWEYIDFNSPSKVPEGVLDKNGLIRDASHFKDGFFNDHDVRVHAYWNLLSGACGYTYGNNAVWQMFKKGTPVIIPALKDWEESLNSPGASQLKHLKRLFKSYPISKLLPDQSIVYGRNQQNHHHIRAAKSIDDNWVLVYLSQGQDVSIVMSKIKNKQLCAYWYNPRNGQTNSIGEFANQGIKLFQPPSQGENNDWVLILDGDENCNEKLKGF